MCCLPVWMQNLFWNESSVPCNGDCKILSHSNVCNDFVFVYESFVEFHDLHCEYMHGRLPSGSKNEFTFPFRSSYQCKLELQMRTPIINNSSCKSMIIWRIIFNYHNSEFNLTFFFFVSACHVDFVSVFYCCCCCYCSLLMYLHLTLAINKTLQAFK